MSTCVFAELLAYLNERVEALSFALDGFLLGYRRDECHPALPPGVSNPWSGLLFTREINPSLNITVSVQRLSRDELTHNQTLFDHPDVVNFHRAIETSQRPIYNWTVVDMYSNEGQVKKQGASEVRKSLFTDFKLHDMGNALGNDQLRAVQTKWELIALTTPLLEHGWVVDTIE